MESGVKAVTVYVAENGGDFRIWQRQVAGAQGQAVFTGEAGKTYEFLAVATDNAGNREAANISNASLSCAIDRRSRMSRNASPSAVPPGSRVAIALMPRADSENGTAAASANVGS